VVIIQTIGEIMDVSDCFSQGLLKKTKPSADTARKSFQIAEDTLLKAKDNYKMGYFDVTVVLCYTAMFHAARAVLFRDGVKERSHVCIVLYLKNKYPDLMTYANMLDSYRYSRHTTLYGLDIITKDADATTATRSAEEFISKMRNFLGMLK
jgi:uncharacterized protein (UPF0332 family)